MPRSGCLIPVTLWPSTSDHDRAARRTCEPRTRGCVTRKPSEGQPMQRIPQLANNLANGLLMPSLTRHLHRHWQDLLMNLQMACKCLQMIENTAFHLQVH